MCDPRFPNPATPLDTAFMVSSSVAMSEEVAGSLGRRRSQTDEVSLSSCRRLAALLDVDPLTMRSGDELPLGWSSILFADVVRQSSLAADGHPSMGEFLPRVALPNRRFAGRSVRIHRPLRIGECVERQSTISGIEPKSGRSGPMLFVTLTHEVSGHEGLAYLETQQIVYLGDTALPPAANSTQLPDASWEERFVPEPILLFRYSAVTFNGHRIHYDSHYAKTVEGYPALVVNGGLTAVRLLEMARSRLTGSVVEYRVRASRPLFAGSTAILRGVQSEDGASFWALDDQQRLAMRIDMKVQTE